MKKAVLFLITIYSFAFLNMAKAAESRVVQIGVNDVYVPAGFDRSADVYAVASGVFPNGCYEWSHAEVIHTSNFSHEVRLLANVSQGMCIMVLVPFSQEVKLGKFEQGKHALKFVNGDGTYIQKNIDIE